VAQGEDPEFKPQYQKKVVSALEFCDYYSIIQVLQIIPLEN
jgi:hypothetical protein